MKTPMNVFNTAMKKKKNRKGFSFVELIVVLVIMAILAAALVPTLIGYIRQTRESNAKNEAAMVVQAAQTISSGAFASANGKYKVEGMNAEIQLSDVTGGTTAYINAVKYLSEVKGVITSITVDSTTYKITNVVYTTENKVQVTYNDGTYSCVTVNNMPNAPTNGAGNEGNSNQ